MDIRPTQAADISALQSVVDQTALFPSEMLPEMVADFLEAAEPEDLWLTCLLNGEPIGLCYARSEMLTEGTWNMVAIAVHPDHQEKGAGAALVTKLSRR